MSIKTWFLAIVLACSLPMTASFANESGQAASKQAGVEITVNVNTATAEEISTLLKGVGIKKAQAIVEYRQQHGAFETQEDLTKVKGIGEATVSKNASRILL